MNTLLDALNESELKRTRIQAYPKDTIIYKEDDFCHEITIVLEGVIEISSFSFQGQEMIYNTILPGQVFGNNLLFSSDPHYKGNVICKTKCKTAQLFLSREATSRLITGLHNKGIISKDIKGNKIVIVSL